MSSQLPNNIIYIFIIASSAYHAGLNNKLRTSVLDNWISSKIQVVVATVAFGLVFHFLGFTKFFFSHMI